jgi:hypothetical protein
MQTANNQNQKTPTKAPIVFERINGCLIISHRIRGDEKPAYIYHTTPNYTRVKVHRVYVETTQMAAYGLQVYYRLNKHEITTGIMWVAKQTEAI